MSYTSEPADQIVRYSLQGTEVALKLSGLAAKNFAVFAYAVLRDHKKTRGKTRLVRLLKEQKPLKFFTLPENRMREFTQEAKRHGLLFVPLRDKATPGVIEITVLAQDAAKVNRIMDRMCLDFVKAAAGEAVPEQAPDKASGQAVPTAGAEVKTETVETELGPVEFVVDGFEDDFGEAGEDAGNFTQGPVDEPPADLPVEPSLSEPSSPSKKPSPMPSAEGEDTLPFAPDAVKPEDRPSVREELKEIRQEQAQKSKQKKQGRGRPVQQRNRSRSKKKAKGR